ncbi:MAG: 50S ribosomal protein L24 [Planctomycetaceae bacterium]|nr:50S ribosomal protein L24 [Planctomycetaceae bacterium]
MRIKQGDMVVVTNGDDAGSTAHKVLEVVEGGQRLLIEGVNRVYKHVKRGHPKSPQGGRLSIEKPIQASNVMFHCPACGQGVRLGYRYTADGRKERFCKKCSASAGTISPPRPKYVQK